MNPLDDLFREGLGDRKAEVPADLWQKIAARKEAIPAGEALDHLFADRLARRQAPVPAGMWDRIAAARRRTPWPAYALATFLLVLAALTLFLWARPQVPQPEPTALRNANSAAFPLTAPAANAATTNAKAGVVSSSEMPPPPDRPYPAVSPAHTAPTPTRTAAPVVASTTLDVPPPALATAVSALPVTLSLVVVAPLPLPELSAHPTTPGFRALGSNRLRGEVLLGAAYAHQRFTLREGESRAVRDAREVSEFPELSYQLTARLQYRLGQRWSLHSGLTYAEIRNQLEYDALRNGVMTLVRRNNHLRLLEVPVLAGYDLSRGRLRLSLNAGPVANLFTAVGGQYLDPNQGEPRDLASSGHYRGNVGLGWTASLTTTYTLGASHATQLLLEPFFKSYPRSFTHPGAPLGEHYWMAGLQLGLRRAF
ncbi:hypothetical protein GGR26_001715 [Lewinella marina]|uniref:Outer membrane protein beta-barrel domain-containing protein n=1 Tax=Neolewinella marina TaxID=438751 RepID=A0A2G0CDL9_9BACT|nr:PorT family protein [Neolewinella marina]NJB85947.1 hypothetical protein [Neolewinella marina]PHK98081.1 hypothetical protein CGL56_12895 [Neolewinella marina]